MTQRLAPTRPPLFTPLEEAALSIGRQDSVGGFGTGTMLGLRRLFGIPTANRLADDRLEALRQVAVLERSSPSRAIGMAADLAQRGFSVRQIEALMPPPGPVEPRRLRLDLQTAILLPVASILMMLTTHDQIWARLLATWLQLPTISAR